MAIIKSAKKAVRQAERRYVFNIRRKRTLHTSVQAARATHGTDRAAQTAALSAAYKAIDKALQRGVIKKNTAARKKARLSAFLKKSTKK
ncbi:MAG: 30S ribosomal protein S20 [Patescibacteria group bacterium]